MDDPTRLEFFLDGGAGVGKTSVASWAVEQLQLKKVCFAAYTAKAARVMRDKGMAEAATLHSLLYNPKVEDGRIVGWTKWALSPLRFADLIVVDEVSMVSEEMAEDIRSFKRPILVLGDVDGQLPPISGLGAFTNRRPDFRLHHVARVAAESPITKLAWIARRGGELALGGPPEARVAPLDAAAWELILNRDWQVICGKHKSRLSVTRRAREKNGFTGSVPQPGEPIICRRNVPTFGLINGDIAVVWRITKDEIDKPYFEAIILIDGEEREVSINRYTFEEHSRPGLIPPDENRRHRYDRADFDWAYAITVYSAQGSEFENVIFIDDLFAKWDKDLRRRLIYTAITRAREKVVVFKTG